MSRFLLIILVMSLSGCLIIPVPVDSEPEPYSENLLYKIGSGGVYREDVLESMGKPNVTRENGSIWIYGEFRRVVSFFIVAFGGGYSTHNVVEYQFAIVEFEQDLVKNVETVQDINGCTSTGVCVARWGLSVGSKKLHSRYTVISSEREDDEIAKSFKRIPDKCSLYIYTRERVFSEKDGIRVSLDSSPHLLLTPKTYLYHVLEPGSHTLTAQLTEDITVQDIDCTAGSARFVELEIDTNYGWSKGKYVIKPIGDSEGREAILDRNLVLSDWVNKAQKVGSDKKQEIQNHPVKCSLFVYRTNDAKKCSLVVQVEGLDAFTMSRWDYINPEVRPGSIVVTAIKPHSKRRKDLTVKCDSNSKRFVKIKLDTPFGCALGKFTMEVVDEAEAQDAFKDRRLIPFKGNAE